MKTELDPPQSDYDDGFDDIVGTPDMQALDDRGDAIVREHEGNPLNKGELEAANTITPDSNSELELNPSQKDYDDKFDHTIGAADSNPLNKGELEAANTITPDSKPDATGAALGQLENSIRGGNGFLYNPSGEQLGDLSSIDNSIRSKLSRIASNTVSWVSQNKGKSAATTLTIGSIIALGTLGGSTLSLVSAKNNAEKKYNDVANSVLDSRFGQLAAHSRSGAIGKIFKNFRLEANANKLADAMDKAGYEILPDGKVKLPADADGVRRTISEVGEVKAELKTVAKDTLPGGSLKNIRQRSKAVKILNKRLGIAARAAADGVASGAEDVADEVTDEAAEATVVQNSREDAFKPPDEDSFDEIVDSHKELGETLEDLDKTSKNAAEDQAETLVRNGAEQAGENTARDIAGDVAVETAEKAGRKALSSVSGWVKGALPDILDRSCQAAQLAKTTYILALVNKRVNLIKLFSVFASNADAVVTGRVNPKLLNAFMGTIQKDPKTGLSWMNSAGMISLITPGVVSLSAADKSMFSTSRDGISSNNIMNFLIGLASLRFLGYNACSVIRGTITQVLLTVGEYGAQAALCVVTACTGTAVATGAEAAAKQSVSKMVGKAIGKAVLHSVAEEAAMAVGLSWLKAYSNNVFTSTIGTFSKSEGGPYSGNIFGAGAGAYYESAGRSKGMRPLSKLAYVDLLKDARENRKQELAKLSLFDRFFDLKPSEHDSLATLALTQSPIAWQKPTDVALASFNSLANFSTLNQIQQFASATVSGSAYAQDGNVLTDDNGYVVDIFGNYIVGNQLEDIDPVANFNSLQESGMVNEEGEPVEGSKLEQYITDCAQVDIHTKDDASNDIKPNCVSTSSRKYQAYLADYTNSAGLDAGYNPVYAEADRPTSTGSSTATGSADEDTSGLSCPTGTEDGGVQQDFGPGRTPTVKIKICGIPGSILTTGGVNASAAKSALDMITAAKSSGLDLTGSAFRSYDTQKALRVAHGCADDSLPAKACDPETARPGDSLHEVGLAIDFNSCRARTTRCFQWLADNAATYGFKNLPSEPWHWSTTGG